MRGQGLAGGGTLGGDGLVDLRLSCGGAGDDFGCQLVGGFLLVVGLLLVGGDVQRLRTLAAVAVDRDRLDAEPP